jgi:hypothetical protein
MSVIDASMLPRQHVRGCLFDRLVATAGRRGAVCAGGAVVPKKDTVKGNEVHRQLHGIPLDTVDISGIYIRI